MSPMIKDGKEATGSMGTDTPIAVLSSKYKPLYNFFKQLFAQVTNPAIDPIREKMVMSLMSILGPRKNVLSLEPINTKCLKLDQPILTNKDIDKITIKKHLNLLKGSKYEKIYKTISTEIIKLDDEL